MQPIIRFGVKDWITGIGAGQHTERGGLFSVADGINPFLNPSLNSATFGLLQPCDGGTEIGAAVVDQTIVALIPRDSRLYGLGNSGDFYMINVDTTDSVTVTANNDTTSFDEDTGGARTYRTVAGFIAQDTSANERLYYINDAGSANSYREIGSWDFSTTFDNDALTGTTNLNTVVGSAFRPIHYWEGTHWIGDLWQVSKVTDNPFAFTQGSLTLGRYFLLPH